MEPAGLLLDSESRRQIEEFFEPRAELVDSGHASVREGIAFLQARGMLPPPCGETTGPAAAQRLEQLVRVIATVAWSDLSSAFSLWCHRMVLEYLSWAPLDSPLRTTVRCELQETRRLGSTVLAAAIAHFLGQAPLPVSAHMVGDSLVLNGRIHWASNLFVPDVVMVMAVAVEGRRPLVVAVPGDRPGVAVDPYPRLLALQGTGSSSLQLSDVSLDQEWIITDDFDRFIQQIRPPFLILQSSFAWGLACRALTQVRGALRGVGEIFRTDLNDLERQLAEIARRVCAAIHADGAEVPMRELVCLRLECAVLAQHAVALEAKVLGGRGYVATSPTARRLREAAFLPIQSPTEGQLRWELAHSA